jgi:hypothetical protein
MKELTTKISGKSISDREHFSTWEVSEVRTFTERSKEFV